jgi:hypothetical protein
MAHSFESSLKKFQSFFKRLQDGIKKRDLTTIGVKKEAKHIGHVTIEIKKEVEYKVVITVDIKNKYKKFFIIPFKIEKEIKKT